jgi:TatD DNase family protein
MRSMPLLTDAHGHLQADRFNDDYQQVAQRARDAGVVRLLIPSYGIESSEGAFRIAPDLPWADLAIGIHPYTAVTDAPGRDALLARATDPRVVAIGETGIDTKRDFAPLAAQIENLEAHIDVAAALGKPLILHCRSLNDGDEAQRELLATLKRSAIGAPGGAKAFGGRVPFILHSASGSAAYVEEALALGGAVSISGLAFRAEESATGEWVALIPPDRLLTETDAPWLTMPGAPDPHRNEPANVALTLAWIAERRGEPIEPLARTIAENFDRIFPRGSGAPPRLELAL